MVVARRSKYMKPDGPTSRLTGDCSVDACDRPIFRQGYCSAHFKRKQRNKVVSGPISASVADGGVSLGDSLSPEEHVIIAGSALLETSSEDDALYKFRRRRFLKAAARWMESRGWTPPKGRG